MNTYSLPYLFFLLPNTPSTFSKNHKYSALSLSRKKSFASSTCLSVLVSFSSPIHSAMHPSPLFLLSPTLLALTAAEMTCYYPDTTVATGHIPCNATASNTSSDASACCNDSKNGYCLANGLCWDDGILSRGSCTDKNWAAPSCAQWCQQGRYSS